jgi:tape measure domain-containing protein
MALQIEVQSNTRQARSDLARLNKSVDNISTTTTNMANKLQKSVTILTAGIAGLVAAKGLVKITDQFTLVENRIALVTGRTKELNKTFKELQEVSIRSRGSLEGIADLYNRIGRSTKSLGVSNQDVIKVTETIQKAIVISGAGRESANAAIVQLGQGLAAGALRGQELNSVMEQTPRVAAAIAAELNVGVGGLRKLAEQGKITSEVVVKAFTSQREIIEKEFEAVNATVGEGFSQVGQGAALMTREFIAGTGAADSFAQKLLTLGASLTRGAPSARAMGEAINRFLYAPAPKDGLFGDLFTKAEDQMSGFQKLLSNLGIYKAIDLFKELMDTVVDLTDGLGDKALKKVENFTQGVNDAFFWVMDKVVGNSWWPDLIDGVVNYTDNLVEALFKVEDFTSKVSRAFKKALTKVLGDADSLRGKVQEGLAVAFAGLSLGLSVSASGGAGIAAGLTSELAKGSDYIRSEYPKAYDFAASAAALALTTRIGALQFLSLPLALGSALAAGLESSTLITAIEELARTISNSVGRAFGAVIANIIPIVIGGIGAIFSNIGQIGGALLDELGIIGDILGAIPFSETIVGALTAAFIVFNWGGSLFGGAFKTAVTSAGNFLLKTMGSARLAEEFLSVGAIGSTVFNKLKTLAVSAGLAIQTAFAGQTTISGLITVVSALSKEFLVLASAVFTNVTAFIANNAAMVATRGLAVLAALANGVLTASFLTLAGVTVVVANFARAMWIAISGPLAPFMVGLLALIALFTSTGAAADGAADEFDKVEGKANNTRNKIANLFGFGIDLNINVMPTPKSVEETFTAVEEANEASLYRVRRQLEGSYWFDWMNDVSTSLQIMFTNAFTNVINSWKGILNGFISFFNDTFGADLEFFVLESRDAIEQMLDNIDPELRIRLNVNADDLNEFTDGETRGMVDSTLETINRLRSEIADARNGVALGFGVDEEAIATLNRQLEVQERRLKSVTNALTRQVNVGKNLKGLKNSYQVLNDRLRDSTTFLGEQFVEGKKFADIARLTAKEQEKYTNEIAKAQDINGTIQGLLNTNAELTSEQKDQLAEQLALLGEQSYVISQIGVDLEKFSTFDLATSLGLDANLIGKLTDTVLDKITTKQQEIVDKEREIAEIRRKGGDLAGLDKAQKELTTLEREGDVLVEGAERSLLSMFDKLTGDLNGSDIAISASEFFDLGPELQTRVTDYADKLRELNLKIAGALGDPDTLSQLEKDKAGLQEQFGDALNIDIDFSQLDNFGKALAPFRDLGINFNADDFSNLGQTFSAEIIAQAKSLNDERKILADKHFANTVVGEQERIDAVAAFNRKLFDLEEATRKAREDALLGEQTAETLGNGFGKSIVDAMTGKADFGESMAALITGKLEQGLQDRIASFAEGFLDSFFEAFSGKDGIMGGIADALKGPDNKESDGLKSAGSGLFDAIGGGGEGGEEGGDPAKAATGIGAFTDKLKEGSAGLGDWASQTLMNIAQFFGLSTATTGTTAALSAQVPAQTANAVAMQAATAAATALAAALTAAAAASVIPGLATGGAVSGPGTGTSDSIMARLSNGEYVINAKQTKKHRKLIEAINQGKELPGYATGGIVDLGASSQAVMADVASRPQPSGNQTTQNINITGDISRQTKKEIFGMLPQIAVGVNQQNREQNR